MNYSCRNVKVCMFFLYILCSYCDVYQKCRDVDPSGPWATLRKLLLSEENIESVKSWIISNWFTIVFVIIVIAILLVSQTFSAYFCFRCVGLFLSRSNYVHIGQNNNEFCTFNNELMTYVHGLVWFVQSLFLPETKKFILHRTCRRRLRIRNLSSVVSNESENTRKLFTKNCVQW